MLYLYRRVAFGEQVHADAAAMADLSLREVLLLAPIAVVVMWMGIYPESFIAPIRADIGHLEARMAQARPMGDARLSWAAFVTKADGLAALGAPRTTGEGSAR